MAPFSTKSQPISELRGQKADRASGCRLAEGVALQWALPSNRHKNDIRIKKRIYKDSGLELNTATQNIQVQLQAPLSGGAGERGGGGAAAGTGEGGAAGREDRRVGAAEKELEDQQEKEEEDFFEEWVPCLEGAGSDYIVLLVCR